MKKLDAVLENKHLIGIAGHVRPDGDCVGSTLAVYNYIRTYYPDADVRLYLEPIPNIFKFLRYSEEIKSEYTDEDIFDLFIACLLYTSPSPRDRQESRMPSSA